MEIAAIVFFAGTSCAILVAHIRHNMKVTRTIRRRLSSGR